MRVLLAKRSGPAAVTIFYFAFAITVMLLRVIHTTLRFLIGARTVAARFSLLAQAQAGR
jgi:hypothetical protein